MNSMKRLIIIFLLAGIAFAAVKAEKDYGTVAVDEIVSVYDGDTFTVNIKSWPKIVGDHIGIRVNGIDTPELKGSSAKVKAAAEKAKNETVYLHLQESRLQSVTRLQLKRQTVC